MRTHRSSDDHRQWPRPVCAGNFNRLAWIRFLTTTARAGPESECVPLLITVFQAADGPAPAKRGGQVGQLVAQPFDTAMCEIRARLGVVRVVDIAPPQLFGGKLDLTPLE